jgi:Fic family protein
MILDGREAETLLEFLRESNAIENVFDEESVDQALHAWKTLVIAMKPPQDLTAHIIKKLHKVLMNNQPLAPNQRGYWRDHNVVVRKGSQVIREFPDYKEVPKLMDQWIAAQKTFFDSDDYVVRSIMAGFSEEQILKAVKQFHIEFENIHPFADGNGRVGRMLFNWHRVTLGFPILVIKAAERENYYKWFRSSS